MIPATLAAAALLLAALIVMWRAAARRAAALEAHNRARENETLVWEGRLERAEVLWLPKVSYRPALKLCQPPVTGVPHCRFCEKPMALSGQEWSCAGCGKRYPESVADVMILDWVAKDALKKFLESHPGYSRGSKITS
jgi:hypothetical protein